MAVIYWNIKGIRARREEIINLCHSQKPSVLALQETLLKKEENFRLNSYKDPLEIPAQITDRGCTGGVSLYIHNSILHSPVALVTPLQAVAARVTLQKTITICNIYLPGSEPLRAADLENLLDQLPRPFVLVGDFNAHNTLWGSDVTSNRGLLLEKVFSDWNLSVLNDGSPTFIHSAYGTKSHLDLAVCDPSLILDFSWKVHSDLCGSDHFPVLLSSCIRERESLPQRFDCKRADWSVFREQLAVHLTEEILEKSDPAQAFTEAIIKCAQASVPKTSGRVQFPKVPWFNRDCREINRMRKMAQRRVFRQPTTQHIREHQRLRAKARLVYKSAKKQSWKSFCSSLTSKTSKKKVWRVIKKLKGKNSSPSVQHLKSAETLITDKQEVANLLAATLEKNSSFQNKCPAFSAKKLQNDKHPPTFESNNTEYYNMPFSLPELTSALQSCGDSAPGSDDVHYQLLKHLTEDGLGLLLRVYNNIYVSGSFPPAWRKALVVPIAKPGKDHTNPSNYRPIALTSCLCKVMEKMVNCRLMWKLETDGLLANEQCGFRKHRSTIDHLVRLETTIRNAFLQKQHVVAVFFDLEKAYDTTWKGGILSDLKDLGFRGRLPQFIQQFLANREFQVRLGTTLSDLHEQEMGVPQGSILSPALFSIKINEIVNSVNPGTEASLFVDDFALYAVGATYVGVQRKLQLCVDKIQNWAEGNGFTFSSTKTQCIHFHNTRQLHLDPEIRLGKSIIPAVTEVKFLGLIFDQKLNFKAHIQYLKDSCQKALNILRVVAHTDWGADRKTLLHLYRALVRSKLDYGCAVYGSARPSYLKLLDPIHHQGLRLCLGAFRTTPVYSLYAEAGEPSLYHRRLRLTLNYCLRLVSEPVNPAYDCVFDPKNVKKFEDNPKTIPPLGIRIRPHLKEAGIDLGIICDESKFPDDPPWTFSCPLVRYDLAVGRKDSISSSSYRVLFGELCSEFPAHYRIYTDGSKSDEGVAAASFCSKVSKEGFSKSLSQDGSVYTAELTALVLALKMVYKSKHRRFLICSDSLSALQAISGRNMNHPQLLEFFTAYTALKSNGFDIVLAWVPGHVGIPGNEKADSLARKASKHKRSNQTLPHTDLKPKVNAYIKHLRQEEWDSQTENKLFNIRPKLSEPLPSAGSNRKEESVLCRLHAGHCYFTHAFLLKGEAPPKCERCRVITSVKHVLVDCPFLGAIRRKHYTCDSIKTLFRDVPPDALFSFLREIDLWKLI